MKGWLIVNSFISSVKFSEIYSLLKSSADAEGMELEIKTTDFFAAPVNDDLKKPVLPDFFIFWDKDIYLAKRLASAGKPVFNSPQAIEICDNKILTALALSSFNVPAPKTIPAPKTFENYGYCNLTFLRNAEKELGYPMVIKEAYGSFGMQVYLAGSQSDAEEIIKKIGSKDFLMQEFVSESSGKDVRINVVDGKVVASMKRVSMTDFRSNITIGGHMEQYEPSEEEKEAALKAAEAVKADWCGVDILFGRNGPLVCEVNSNPHFKSTLECTGRDISRDIMKCIKSRLS